MFHMNGAWGKDIGVWRQANGTTLRGEGSSSDRMVRESRVRNHVPAEWFLNSVAESRFRLNGFRTGKRNHGPALMVRSKGERNHGSSLMVRSKRKRNHGPGEWCLSKKKRNPVFFIMQDVKNVVCFATCDFHLAESRSWVNGAAQKKAEPRS